MAEPKRLLILGGTAEAAELAARAVDAFAGRLDVVSSLAGRLGTTPELPGKVRVGGFDRGRGGGPGLADYLRGEGIDLLVDATHPFAETISMHAHDAALAAGIPRLQLVRPAWRMPPDAKWVEAADMAAAAEILRAFSRRAWLTIGQRGLEAFSHLPDIHFLVRLIEAPAAPLPLADYAVVTGRPPFAVADERALIEKHRIDALVSKQSGGDATVAKIAAAIEAGLRIVLVARPLPEPGDTAATVQDAIAWLAARV